MDNHGGEIGYQSGAFAVIRGDLVNAAGPSELLNRAASQLIAILFEGNTHELAASTDAGLGKELL